MLLWETYVVLLRPVSNEEVAQEVEGSHDPTEWSDYMYVSVPTIEVCLNTAHSSMSQEGHPWALTCLTLSGDQCEERQSWRGPEVEPDQDQGMDWSQEEPEGKSGLQ